MKPPAPYIVAHRGASADAPENTLAAFREAWRQGADAIEGDFRLTADGQLVCLHDAATGRVSERTLTVAETSLAALRALEVGSWKGQRWRGERIPTIGEVLAAVPAGKGVYLELKSGPELLPALALALEASDLEPAQVRVIAFDSEVIRGFKEWHPEIAAFWLTDLRVEEGGLRPDVEILLRTLRACGADGLSSFAHPELTEALVEAIRREGYSYHVWTVDDPEHARALLKMGVRTLTTNTPGALRAALLAQPGHEC